MQPSSRVFEHAHVANSDRAFNYGDGCFTTIRVSNYKLQLLARHINRLEHDAKALGIDFSLKDELLSYLSSDAFVNKLKQIPDRVVKILLSRGSGGRGYMPPIEGQQSLCVISVHNYTAQLTAPLSLMPSSVKLAQQPALAGLKHCNRLEQVLAKQALWAYNKTHNTSFDDVFMLDDDGQVIEASSANIFAFTGEKWVTPLLAKSGVNGVIRQCIIENQGLLNIKCSENAFKATQFKDFQAVFLCNAVHGITAVKSIFTGDETLFFDTQLSVKLAEKLKSLLSSGDI
jgi:4-amino-4-deoxychorismate lyase